MKVMVTAGTTGIGKAIVQKLREEGHYVLATTSNKEKLSEETVLWDMKEPETTQNLFKTFGDVDLFIHCAHSFSGACLSAQIKKDEFMTSLNTNIAEIFELTRQLSRKMNRKKKGHIIFLGSLLALDPAPGKLIYITEKMALQGMLSAFKTEFTNLNYHIIHPALVSTEQVMERIDQNIRDSVGTLLTPQEVAVKISQVVKSPKEFSFEVTLRGGQNWKN